MSIPSVHIAIQSHPDRAAMGRALAAATGGTVYSDPAPDEFRNPWRTYRHILESCPSCTHLVVLQDDATVCDHFAEAVQLVAAARPDRMVILWVGGVPRPHVLAIDQAVKRGEPFAEVRAEPWVPVVGLLWPHELIEPCLAFVDAQSWPEKFRADDEIVSRFMRSEKLTPCATVPSLVEHPDDVPSLIGRKNRDGRNPGRIAYRYIGGGDPRQIAWS